MMCSDEEDAPYYKNPLVGIGFRVPIAKWTMANLHRFDVLEVTVDHYINGGEFTRSAIRNVVDRIPVVLHGVGLSIGTDTPLDEEYLDGVAEAIEDLKNPSYSEHLAWTKVPGLDLANLLPVPKTRAVAEMLIPKIEQVQARLPVPFSLENISYVFDFPDGEMSDAELFNLLFHETGVGMLLDVENLFVNSHNHRIDPRAFLDELPEGVVTGVHAAGGPLVSRPYLDEPFYADNHSRQVPEQALELLVCALHRQRPKTIILERDNDYEKGDELLADVARLREQVARAGDDRTVGSRCNDSLTGRPSCCVV